MNESEGIPVILTTTTAEDRDAEGRKDKTEIVEFRLCPLICNIMVLFICYSLFIASIMISLWIYTYNPILWNQSQCTVINRTVEYETRIGNYSASLEVIYIKETHMSVNGINHMLTTSSPLSKQFNIMIEKLFCFDSEDGHQFVNDITRTSNVGIYHTLGGVALRHQNETGFIRHLCSFEDKNSSINCSLQYGISSTFDCVYFTGSLSIYRNIMLLDHAYIEYNNTSNITFLILIFSIGIPLILLITFLGITAFYALIRRQLVQYLKFIFIYVFTVYSISKPPSPPPSIIKQRGQSEKQQGLKNSNPLNAIEKSPMVKIVVHKDSIKKPEQTEQPEFGTSRPPFPASDTVPKTKQLKTDKVKSISNIGKVPYIYRHLINTTSSSQDDESVLFTQRRHLFSLIQRHPMYMLSSTVMFLLMICMIALTIVFLLELHGLSLIVLALLLTSIYICLVLGSTTKYFVITTHRIIYLELVLFLLTRRIFYNRIDKIRKIEVIRRKKDANVGSLRFGHVERRELTPLNQLVEFEPLLGLDHVKGILQERMKHLGNEDGEIVEVMEKGGGLPRILQYFMRKEDITDTPEKTECEMEDVEKNGEVTNEAKPEEEASEKQIEKLNEETKRSKKSPLLENKGTRSNTIRVEVL